MRQRAAAPPRRIVFPAGYDPRTVEAVARLQQAGLVRPVVLGDGARVRAGLAEHGADPQQIEVVDHRNDARVAEFAATLAERRSSKGWTEATARDHLANPLVFGAMLVATGDVQGSVAGAMSTTGDVIRAAIWCVGLAPGITTISSAFYMVVPPFRGTEGPEVLTFTDAAVVPDPDARQLADIAAAAARARKSIVGDEPRVAFLSFSTRGSAESPSVQKVRDAVANLRDGGIRSFAFFIYGYPGDTPESMAATTQYAIDLDPDFANFYPAVPYPGTALYEKVRQQGLLKQDDWTRMEYSYYLLEGQGLDEPTVMRAINQARRRFFLRPRYVARHMREAAQLAMTKPALVGRLLSQMLLGRRGVDTRGAVPAPAEPSA